MFTLVCLTLSVIQDVFGCEEPLLMEGSNSFEHMAGSLQRPFS